MLDPSHVPPVDAEEFLARFILFSRHFRALNNTVKPDAFIPHPQSALSVTRHREASDNELGNEGERVAKIRRVKLYGRADVRASIFLDQDLRVEARPIPENANHADVTGWPADKPAQKMLATEIASRSQFVSRAN